MDDSIFSKPPLARRVNPHTQHLERPGSSGMDDSRIYTPSLTFSASAASSSQHSLGVPATPQKGSLLQERLRERKVESARIASLNHEERHDGHESLKTSPTKTIKEDRVASNGHSAKGMGIKQVEEQVSALHKLNFDLKLELYHRRQKQEALEAQLEEKISQLHELEETRELNDQLVAELERRDQALDEAVGIIVNLEEKVERLLKEREMVQSIYADSSYKPSPEPSESATSSPKIGEEAGKKSIFRMPSFLSERSEKTEALRSVYLGHQRTFSDGSLGDLAEEQSSDNINSPRLSVLSESSFLSVYGDKLDLNASSKKESEHLEMDATSTRRSEERPDTASAQSPDPVRTTQFLSINDVLDSPLQRLDKLKATLERATLPAPDRSKSAMQKHRRKDGDVDNVVHNEKTAHHQANLPPTPDTWPHHARYGGQAVDGRDAHSRTNIHHINQNRREAALLQRPRSAGETITSRREGHGWDTETQADSVDDESIGSAASTFSPSSFQPLSPRVRRVRTPDLFNFSTADTSGSSWARDVMFSHHSGPEALDQPPFNQKRLLRAQKSNLMEVSPPSTDHDMTQNRYKHENERGATSKLQDNYSLFAPPNNTRPIAASPTANRQSVNAAHVIQSTPPLSRTTRLATKLFGRSPSSNNATTTTPEAPIPAPSQLQTQRPTSSSQYPSVLDSLQSTYHQYQDDLSSATPPPIRRSKTSFPPVVTQPARTRPDSAGQGMPASHNGVRVKRMSGYYEDEQGQFQEAFDRQQQAERGGSRLGNGRERKSSFNVDVGVSKGLGALLAGGNNGDHDAGDGGDGKRKWLGLRRH